MQDGLGHRPVEGVMKSASEETIVGIQTAGMSYRGRVRGIQVAVMTELGGSKSCLRPVACRLPRPG